MPRRGESSFYDREYKPGDSDGDSDEDTQPLTASLQEHFKLRKRSRRGEKKSGAKPSKAQSPSIVSRQTVGASLPSPANVRRCTNSASCRRAREGYPNTDKNLFCHCYIKSGKINIARVPDAHLSRKVAVRNLPRSKKFIARLSHRACVIQLFLVVVFLIIAIIALLGHYGYDFEIPFL